MATEVAAAPAADEGKAAAAKPLVVDPKQCIQNYGGFVFCEYFARLPAGATADCLKEPGLWARVQSSPKPLRKFDRVVVTDFDESFRAEAVVAEANASGAVLAGIDMVRLPARFDVLPQDEKHRVVWVGNGYAVARKGDGKILTRAVHSVQLAAAEMHSLWPRAA